MLFDRIRKKLIEIEEYRYSVNILNGKQIVLLSVLWPILFIPICFVLFFIFNGHFAYTVDGIRQIPTISVTGYYRPESVLFTYGLHLEAVFLVILFFVIYTTYKTKINYSNKKTFKIIKSYGRIKFEIDEENQNQPNENESPIEESKDHAKDQKSKTESKYKNEWDLNVFFGLTEKCLLKPNVDQVFLLDWNLWLLRIGLICAIFMSLVGSISLSVSLEAHSFIAFIMFVAGVLHMLFFRIKIAPYIYKESDTIIKIVNFCLIICIPFNIFMVLLAGIIYLAVGTHSAKEFAIDLMPCLEFTTVLSLLLYLYGFYPEVMKVKIFSLEAPSEEDLRISLAKSEKKLEENMVIHTIHENEDFEEDVEQDSLSPEDVDISATK